MNGWKHFTQTVLAVIVGVTILAGGLIAYFTVSGDETHGKPCLTEGCEIEPRAKADGAILTVESLATIGSKTAALVLFNFQDDTSQPFTPALAAGRMFTDPTSVAAYYNEATWGKIGWTGLSADEAGDTFGWVTIPYDTATVPLGCQIRAWADAADAAAGIDHDAYDRIVYVFPHNRCPWAGAAPVNDPSNVFLNGTVGVATIAHELGHTFGLPHANGYKCRDAAGAPVAISTSCVSQEYGDPHSVMGCCISRHFHNENLSRLGVLAPENVLTLGVRDSGTYTLTNAEQPTASVVAIKVPKRWSRGGHNVHEYYWLEYRRPFGLFDNFPADYSVVNGLSIRFSFGNTNLIDNSPSDFPSFSESALLVGQSFHDGVAQIKMTVLSRTDNDITVEIIFRARQ